MGIWSPREALLGAGRYSRWAGGLRRPSPEPHFQLWVCNSSWGSRDISQMQRRPPPRGADIREIATVAPPAPHAEAWNDPCGAPSLGSPWGRC